MYNLVPEFLEFVKDMNKLDVGASPTYRTALALAKHPLAQYPNPVEVAFAMDIDVNYAFLHSKEFQMVIDSYVEILNKIYKQLTSDFSKTEAINVFTKMASKMSLKYSC